MRLEGKRAIVTGAGSGLGRAIAEGFAAHGARVAVLDIDERAAETVARSIGTAAIGLQADVSDDRAVGAGFDAAREAWGGLDILVNNAGVAQRGAPAMDVEEGQIDRILAVNVRGIFHCTRHALSSLRESQGTILNIASNAGLRPRPGAAWYNASKAAVINLTYSLAAEYAHQRIRVNALAPALAGTAMKEFILGEDPGGQIERAIVASIPMGRLTEGADIASAAVFLVSEEASFITGVVLPVDGGRMVA